MTVIKAARRRYAGENKRKGRLRSGSNRVRGKEKINKPLRGQLKELGNFRHLKEFRSSGRSVGDKIDASVFKEGDVVNVIGTVKGRGFQGVVKRHGFGGGPKTHGQKNRYRAPGSIGSTALQRVVKGRRMAGRMGGNRVTVKT